MPFLEEIVMGERVEKTKENKKPKSKGKVDPDKLPPHLKRAGQAPK